MIHVLRAVTCWVLSLMVGLPAAGAMNFPTVGYSPLIGTTVHQIEIARPKHNQVGPPKSAAPSRPKGKPSRNTAGRNTRDREPRPGDKLVRRVPGGSPGGGDRFMEQLMMGVAQGLVGGIANGMGSSASPQHGRKPRAGQGSRPGNGRRSGPCTVDYTTPNPVPCSQR